MGWFTRKPKPDPADAMRGLREQALTLDPAAVGLEPTAALPHVWGVIMETGYPQAVVSLVVFADGTTSLYISNGGGIIGAGTKPPVRAAAERLLTVAESERSKFVPTADTAPPKPGHVRVLLRTFDGLFAADGAEVQLGVGSHPLSTVFYAAQGVITAIRETTPAP